MPKNDYWKKRMEALEDLQYQKSQEYYSDVQKQYDNALRKIQKDTEVWYARLAENNDISYAEAKKFLKDSDLEEFKWNVEQYIKAGRENAIDESWMKELENASAKFHISRLEAIQMQIRQHVELLKAQFECGLTEHLTESFQDQFYRNAFEIANGTGIGTNLSKWDPEKADMVIRTPWAQDGKAFSDRIWDNKEKLVRNLHTELSQCIIRGEAPDTAIKNLAKKMNVSKKQAGNLIMTETAAISAMAQQKCFSELGIEEFEVVETLDGHTCDICQGMDSLHFPMNDFKVGVTAPPFHPRCRGCTCPYFNDEFTEGEERSARNQVTGKTEYVEDITYEEWKKEYVDSISMGDSTDTWAKEAKEELLMDEKSLSSRKKETAVVYGPDGKFLFQKRGNEKEVQFRYSEFAKLRNCVISHNHPSGGSFSVTDIILLQKSGASEIRVTTEEGVYFLRSHAKWNIQINSGKKIRHEMNKIKEEVALANKKLYNEKNMTKAERFRHFSNASNELFAERFGLEYGKETFED